MNAHNELFQKYDKPIPRYTSYPSYPYWIKDFSYQNFLKIINKNIDKENFTQISLYVHMPFCEKLCHFCGCNKVITKNHDVERTYIDALLTEWKVHKRNLPKNFVLKELHLGGGTPTFFSPQNLEFFLKNLFEDIAIFEEHDFSLEAHPGVTEKVHLDVLKAFNFNRLSLGVQDFNEKVQRAIGRHQTFSDVEFCTNYARQIGFKSINYDLIYGLPYQTEVSIIETFEQVCKLKPDRVAFYSYAHLPALKPSQKKLSLPDRPSGEKKYAIYKKGYDILTQNEYVDLGYDHFALKTDDLYHAFCARKLHRNFMGFTVQNTPVLVGLGVSAISDYGQLYVQNRKSLQEYMAQYDGEIKDFETGFFLSNTDSAIKRHILDLSCYRWTSLKNSSLSQEIKAEITKRLQVFIEDGLCSLYDDNIQILERGTPFIRNICSCFDVYFHKAVSQRSHSQSV